MKEKAVEYFKNGYSCSEMHVRMQKQLLMNLKAEIKLLAAEFYLAV